MKKVILISLFYIVLLGCQKTDTKYEDQLVVVDSMVNFLYRSDTNAIKSSISNDLKDIGIDEERIRYYINSAHRLLIKHGIPKRDQYQIKEYADEDPNLVDIIIPIVETDKTKVAELTFFFVKYIPGNHLSHFWIVRNLQSSPTNAPNLN